MHTRIFMACRPFLMALTLMLGMALPVVPARAADSIVVASTTSTEASGLFTHLLPIFTKQTGITVKVVAQGTGQALDIARRGDADVVLVHDRAAEEAFVADGWGLSRREVMFNDFVVIGPGADPAGILGGKDTARAFARIASAKAPFASRGDDSGTHRAEKRFWKAAGITPTADWYRETGAGMGATLNTAAGLGAYTLTDRGTWISFKNRQDLRIVLEGDPKLFNQYGVIVVNPARHPHVKQKSAQAFADWLVSEKGQEAIAGFKVNGDQLFFPNAAPTN